MGYNYILKLNRGFCCTVKWCNIDSEGTKSLRTFVLSRDQSGKVSCRAQAYKLKLKSDHEWLWRAGLPQLKLI